MRRKDSFQSSKEYDLTFSENIQEEHTDVVMLQLSASTEVLMIQ
jgi:hypothetical protein